MTAVFERRAALAVAVAVLTALAGPVSAAPASAGGPAPALDESTLTQPIRFQVSDLDPGAPACVDLASHANDKWLAAHPIPGDQTNWGAFTMLRQRSVDIQKQIAERAAAEKAPTGVEKIVADFRRLGWSGPGAYAGAGPRR